jgi:tetratricopeptide (TPR) repeat protein
LLTHTPNDAGLWTELGFAQLMLQDFDQAIDAFDEAISLHPGHAWAHLLAANSYRQKGDPESGLAYAKKAVELAPHLPNTWAALGNIQLELEQPVAAKDSFSQGIARKPDDLDSRYGYARAADAAESSDQEEAWLAVLSLDPPPFMIKAACQHLDADSHPACAQAQ